MINLIEADRIYLGEVEVTKIYKGEEVVAEAVPTPSGADIYTRNGSLIFPEGLIINIEDYSAEEPTKTPYPLPEEIALSDAGYISKTFDDGTRFGIYPDVEGNEYPYAQDLEYCTDYWASSKKISGEIYYSSISSFGTTITNSYTYGAQAGLLYFKTPSEWDYINLTLKNFYMSSSGSLYYALGLDKIYIHDYGEGTLYGSTGFYLMGSKTPLDENDIQLDYTKSGSWDLRIYKQFEEKLIPNHRYLIYAICSSSKRSDNMGRYSICGSGSLALRDTVPYTRYDEALYVSGQGYSFGDSKDARISISTREPHPEWGEAAFGTARYNPDQGWYEFVPVNNEGE